MNEEQLKEKFLVLSKKEFEEKNFGSTEQYLEVINIALDNGRPIIKLIEKIEGTDNYAVHYVIDNERFFYTHYFEVCETIKLYGDGITPETSVYLRVYSDNMPLSDMLDLTTLPATRFWSIGDKKGTIKSVDAVHNNSRFLYEKDDNVAINVEQKLLSILETLENHKDEFNKLKKSRLRNLYIGLLARIHKQFDARRILFKQKNNV